MTGAQAGDYTLTIQSPATATITPMGLTVTATGVNKIYDGTTTATVTLSDNRIAGDVLTDSYTAASFSSNNVATGATVTVTGISISGPDASNYTLLNTTATATANIYSNIMSSQLASSIVQPPNTTIGSFGQQFFNTFNPPAPGVYFYHPLIDIDSSSFNNSSLDLGNDVFEFIDGRLNIVAQ